MKIFYFFLLFFLITNSSLKAENKDYFDFNLEDSYQHQASKKLRKSFDNSNLQKRQSKLLQEKFIVLEVKKGDFGGYFLTIVTHHKNTSHKFRVWQIWMYDISGANDEFQIRNVKEYAVNHEDEKRFLPLTNKENLKYWQ